MREEETNERKSERERERKTKSDKSEKERERVSEREIIQLIGDLSKHANLFVMTSPFCLVFLPNMLE